MLLRISVIDQPSKIEFIEFEMPWPDEPPQISINTLIEFSDEDLQYLGVTDLRGGVYRVEDVQIASPRDMVDRLVKIYHVA